MKVLFDLVKYLTIISMAFYFSGLIDKLYDKSPEKITDGVTAKIAEKCRNEKRLYLIDSGEDVLDDISIMSADFHYYREVDIDSARALLVYCVEEYLQAINSSKKIRSYLHEYPFTVRNIEIRIYFYRPEGKDPPLGGITEVSAIDGRVNYKTLDTLKMESYEEARRHAD